VNSAQAPDARRLAAADEIYVFGDFVLDRSQRLLTRASKPVAVTAKSFDALHYLVARRGELVSRADLSSALWPTTVVEDNNLSQTIKALRRALGDSESGSRFIVTVPRQGYQFVADVTRRSRKESPKESTEEFPNASPPTAYLKALALHRSSGGIGASMTPLVRQSIKHFLDEAVRLDPRSASALGWRAQIAADSLQFDSFPIAERDARIIELTTAVARDARDALQIDPSVGIAYSALTRLHLFEFRLDDALATITEAQRLAPADAAIWQTTSLLHSLRNKGDAAVAAARRAIELDPRNLGTYQMLGIALQATGHNQESIRAYTRMIEIAPTAGIGYVGLARALTTTDDTRRTRQTLKAAEHLLGDTHNLALQLALTYAHIGADADAKRHVDGFRRAMSRRYINPALEAMALLATREHAHALAVLRRTVENGRRGMEQMPLTFIRYNTWNDPVLQTGEWVTLRERLAFRRNA
jgi:DNA-binding winged helix-turn-helix (wHTH) protein/tetratricopeptide (TPR) repeat protein